VDDDTEGRAEPTAAPPGGPPGVAGWFPDPWSATRRRWWTGEAWTFATIDATDPSPAGAGSAGPAPASTVQAPTPTPLSPPTPVTAPPVAPPPVAPSPPPMAPPPPLPAAVPATMPTKAGPQPASTPPSGPPPGWSPPGAPGSTGGQPTSAKVAGLVAIVVFGLIAGLLGVRFLVHRARSPGTLGQAAPGTASSRPQAPPTSTDASRTALSSLIVKPADVASTLRVALLIGGDGLEQPTLDLCNAAYPSELLRSARLQDVVVDDQGQVQLSTEAVLYRNAAAAEQAFAELSQAASSCPSTPVPSPAGEPAVTTTFNPPPDGDWPQTDTVNRKAFDFTTVDAAGETAHYVAVYLQRGRALMGVYFPRPETPPTVAGQSTISGVVGVFAERMAALPASVVGS
jgi:hypothetical protein